MRKEKVTLLDGTTVYGDCFDLSDFEDIREIFKSWLDISIKLKKLGGRSLNVPDVISESLFCIAFNAARTNNTARSFDCVLRKTGEGVQIKSASISNDCTSFGPCSTWDLLYFMDFIPNGTIDGIVNVYQIDTTELFNIVLNAKKGETFKDQQLQGRRPRLSIQNQMIKSKDLKPIKVIDILNMVIY